MEGSPPRTEWLRRRGWRQEDCGLAAIPHFRVIPASPAEMTFLNTL
jgi:hypothetical protein